MRALAGLISYSVSVLYPLCKIDRAALHRSNRVDDDHALATVELFKGFIGMCACVGVCECACASMHVQRVLASLGETEIEALELMMMMMMIMHWRQLLNCLKDSLMCVCVCVCAYACVHVCVQCVRLCPPPPRRDYISPRVLEM